MFSNITRHLRNKVDMKKCLPRHNSTTTINSPPPSTDVHEDNEASATVLVEKDNNITLIGLNRPQKRNSIDTQTAAALSEAISSFEADHSSPVAVLYGVGGTFCAGNDIVELEEQLDHNNVEFLLRPEGSIGPTRRKRHFSKPIICGINGFCVGSGLELALACDLRVMENTAVLGFFNRVLGVPISDGGTVRLAAAVGFSQALDIISTGRRVDAAEALRIGLINRLVATGTALGQAVHLAFTIAKFQMPSLQHDRRITYLNTYERKGFTQAIQNEIMNTSNEVLEEIHYGVQRFKNAKHSGLKPDFKDIKEKDLPAWEKEEIAIEEMKKKLDAAKNIQNV